MKWLMVYFLLTKIEVTRSVFVNHTNCWFFDLVDLRLTSDVEPMGGVTCFDKLGAFFTAPPDH